MAEDDALGMPRARAAMVTSEASAWIIARAEAAGEDGGEGESDGQGRKREVGELPRGSRRSRDWEAAEADAEEDKGIRPSQNGGKPMPRVETMRTA